MNKSPLGGEKTRENPTDRGKRGVKRSVLIDGRGGRSERRWTVPMCMIRNWLLRRSTTFRWNVQRLRRVNRSIFVSTKDIRANRWKRLSTDGATKFTFR